MSEENQFVRPERLNAAIACLDLSLEAELALFRHRLSQETVALAALPSTEAEALALGVFGSTTHSALFSPEREQTNAPSDDNPKTFENHGLATIETDDEETLPESYSAELTSQPKAFDQFLDPSIEDYLQSSEALLKHLNQSAAADSAIVDKPVNVPKRSWFMVTGMTLLILGTLALAGFLIMLAVRWFSIKPSPSGSQTQIQPSPLQTLSVSPLPNSAISPSQTPLTTEGVSSQPTNTASSGIIPATEGVPTLTTNAPATSTPSISPNAARYVVLSIANRPESLKTAQRLVPDAYVTEVEGQRRIQLAALDNLQQAQQMVNELKNQGFPATIVAQN
jgi:cell division septation protein DedD